MFDPQTLLSTYRVLLRRSRRFVDASAWILLAGILAFVALAWLGPTRERGASDTADAIATGCKLLLVFGAAAVLAGMGKFTPWQAKRLGLVCPECGRPLTAATIEYALDTGDCWHCRPPVPVEVVEPDAPLPPESGNPYQPPTTTEPHPAESAADVQPQAAASPISTPLMLLFGGPVAYLLIWQSLAGDDETWWKNNRLPADRYPTPEAEAEHRAQFLRAVRRHGWYQLVPLVAIPAVATWLMLVYAPQPMHKFDFVIGSMGVFLLSSSAAYQAASRVNRSSNAFRLLFRCAICRRCRPRGGFDFAGEPPSRGRSASGCGARTAAWSINRSCRCQSPGSGRTPGRRFRYRGPERTRGGPKSSSSWCSTRRASLRSTNFSGEAETTTAKLNRPTLYDSMEHNRCFRVTADDIEDLRD
ncbi:MAG: hypothetical protein MUF06_14355, partial [Pirellulaceae bacterium]|nr:hypothetical protein [Pirellulaceae bacterium]